MLKKPQYHVKENGKWHWQKNAPDADTIYVQDDSFLLFKANQTINNPYIAIRIESDPMEITFDNIEKTDYGYDANGGIQINLYNLRGNCLDNVYVKLIPVLTSTVTEDVWGSEGLNYDVGISNAGTLNWNWDAETVPFEWDPSYLKSLNGSWTGTSSALNPIYCSSFLMNQDEDHTIPYLLLIGDSNTLAGIVYLEREVK
ncbi:MAG: hypothetical protein LUC37_02560 [Prevotella sp.]|nr:hypothetical protein [Prevotella sp.]